MTDLKPITAPTRRGIQPWLAALTVIAVTVGALISIVSISTLAQARLAADELAAGQAVTISELAASLDESRDQLQENGLNPVVPSSDEIVAGPPGSAGARGYDGRDGTDGTDGADGVDGADGAAGAPGAPGSQGPAGSPGEPPYSWEETWFGNTYECVRTDPFVASAPTYNCNLKE